jgi:hypothetical protein
LLVAVDLAVGDEQANRPARHRHRMHIELHDGTFVGFLG